MENINASNSKGINANNPAIPASKPGISHAPLNLGDSSPEPIPVAAPPKQTVIKPADDPIPAERIKGMKTFFAKLHQGALVYLEEQITNWLKENPNIVIKRTNITTGEVQGKTTEPNIVIIIWY